MSETHLDFGHDHIPESERHNPHAFESFDWAKIFEDLDGEVESAERELSAEEFAKLSAVLVRLLGWCVSGKDTQNRGMAPNVCGRTFALLAAVSPKLVGVTQAEVAARLGISKQRVSVTFAEARAHVRRLKRARG